jgi:hypothetical protein
MENIDLIYPYSSCNQIQNPNLYMYTPLQGVDFFVAYASIRNNAISVLCQNIVCADAIRLPLPVIEMINTLRNSENIVFQLPPDVYKLFLNMVSVNNRYSDNMLVTEFLCQIGIFETKTVFETILSTLVSKQNNQRHDWFDFYISRFEITKKIYENYSFPSKQGSGTYKSIESYSLMALVLLVIFSFENNLRYLNTALKINEFLCSVINEIEGKAITMTIGALLLEMTKVAEIIRKIKMRNVYSK